MNTLHEKHAHSTFRISKNTSGTAALAQLAGQVLLQPLKLRTCLKSAQDQSLSWQLWAQMGTDRPRCPGRDHHYLKPSSPPSALLTQQVGRGTSCEWGAEQSPSLPEKPEANHFPPQPTTPLGVKQVEPTATRRSQAISQQPPQNRRWQRHYRCQKLIY